MVFLGRLRTCSVRVFLGNSPTTAHKKEVLANAKVCGHAPREEQRWRTPRLGRGRHRVPQIFQNSFQRHQHTTTTAKESTKTHQIPQKKHRRSTAESDALQVKEWYAPKEKERSGEEVMQATVPGRGAGISGRAPPERPPPSLRSSAGMSHYKQRTQESHGWLTRPSNAF